MRVLALMALSDGKARDKLAPLLGADGVREVLLVRARPVPLSSERLRQVTPASRPRGGLGRFWFCLRETVALARRERPDLVVGFYLLPWGVVAWLAARLAGRRVVLSLTGTDFNRDLRSRLWGPVLRAVLRRSDAVAVFGAEAREELGRLGVEKRRIAVLPNTVDTGVYRPRPEVVPETDLIFVGYLRAAKRVDLVLRSLARLRERRPGARLTVVGDGPESVRLEALAGELGVAGAVRFAGFRDDVAAELARARLFVSLTEMEGLPAALLEALCCGLPAIVSDVGAVGSVLRSGRNGYCVEAPADPERVAALAARILEDPEHYAVLSADARRAAESHGYAAGTGAWERLLKAAVRF